MGDAESLGRADARDVAEGVKLCNTVHLAEDRPASETDSCARGRKEYGVGVLGKGAGADALLAR